MINSFNIFKKIKDNRRLPDVGVSAMEYLYYILNGMIEGREYIEKNRDEQKKEQEKELVSTQIKSTIYHYEKG